MRALAFLLLLAAAGPATAQTVLLAQDKLADLGPNEVTGVDWTAITAGELKPRFCGAAADVPARMALATRRLTRHEREACPAATGGKLVETLIGRRALLAMTGGVSFGLTPELLYRALAQTVPAGNKLVGNTTARWRDIDSRLPDAPIRVLSPPAGSAEDTILRDIVLYDGCSTAAATALPADPVRRLALCTALRTDAAVVRAEGTPRVVAWLHDQGAAAVALIGVAALLAEPELETALPLDGVVPSFATIADGRYRATLPVYLLTVLTPATVQTVAAVGGALLSESAIGPLGTLPRHGLAPLAAADRVKLRAELGRMVEAVTN